MSAPRGKTVTLNAFVILALVILSAPTLVVLGASFTSGNLITFPPDGFSLKWYAKVVAASDLRQAFFRSLQVALICTLIAIPVGTLAGLALTKYRVRFGQALQIYLLLPFTIPLIGSGIGLMLVFGEAGVLGSLWPVGVAACVINLPFMIWAVTASAASLAVARRRCRPSSSSRCPR
jgi:putative spermidine/putrescine transport system permease protein